MLPINLFKPKSKSVQPDSKGTFPTLPVERLLGALRGPDCFVDPLRIMEVLMPTMKSPALIAKLKSSPSPTEKITPTHRQTNGVWEPVVNAEGIPMISTTDLAAFCEWFMLKRRLSAIEKQQRLASIGIHVQVTAAPIENDVLYTLEQVIPFVFQRQYRVGTYRLDAFVERIRLGIEIDEGNHSAYDVDDEKRREQAIRDASISLLRFNPHSVENRDNPGLMLIKAVWKHWASIEFESFRKVHGCV